MTLSSWIPDWMLQAKKTYYQRSQEAEKCEDEVNKIKSNKASVETKTWDRVCIFFKLLSRHTLVSLINLSSRKLGIHVNV